MIGVVDAELFKLRTTRAFWAVALSVVGLVLVAGILDFALSDFRPFRDIMGFTVLAQILALVLGVLTVTNEYRHGTITPTLLITPSRPRLLAAKLVAAVATAVGLEALITVVLLVLTLVFGQDTDGAGRVIAGSLASVALYAALGVGVGALFGSQIVAIIVSLLYPFFGELVLSLIPKVGDVVGDIGLTPNGWAFTGTTFGMSGDRAQGTGGLILLAWAAVFAIAGFVMMRRRDVTA